MDKKNIAVLFGGCSTEYSISLQSAYAVISFLDSDRYNTTMIGISPQGEWFRFTGDLEKIKTDTWCNPDDCVRAIISPSRDVHGVLVFEAGGARAIRLDAAMPVLHGKNGEDGTVQGLLALAGIPVVGCGTLSSALCMDKDRAHKIAALAGVRVPRSFVVTDDTDLAGALAQADDIGYPLVVKPVKSGSSFGLAKADTREQLVPAVKVAFAYDDEVHVEEFITGFEVGCAVMGAGGDLEVGTVDEIELLGGDVFDYTEKYTQKTTKIHLPARIPAHKAAEIQSAAKAVYTALGCSGFARVDLFLTPSGGIVFNEVNTIPGFTEHSRFPKMMRGAGYAFGAVVDKLIETAVSPC